MSDGQALDGIRVLDLSGTIAGWVAGMLLGDFGAEVVYVPPPGRVGAAEVPGEAMWHRNKVCSSIDWTSSADLAVLRGLLAGADVCISTEAGVSEALDLAHPANSRLVHLSVPSCVPLESGGLELDTLASALFGIARRQSSFDGGPVDSVYPFVLYTQGLWAATTAVAALVEREGSGLGQRIEVDGLHGVLVTHTAALVIDPTAPPLDTAVGPGGHSSLYAPYCCSDGQWLFFSATGRFLRAAFEALGVLDVLDDPRINGLPANLDTPENRPWVTQAIADAISAKPRDHWLEKISEVGCPVGRVDTRDTWLDHPQSEALGQRKVVTDPIDGDVVMGGTLVELTKTPAREPAPRRVVASAGLPSWPAQRGGTSAPARETGRGPLDGIRVINLGLFFAGPFAGVLLAELGADVAKVERREGNNNRDGGWHFIRGQRSLAVDLRDPVGHRAFLELVSKADVVVDNYRPGVLERLKIDYDALASVRPDIITVSVSGFGEVGPLGGRPGMDPILQATSGMMTAQGGESAPVFHSIAVNDAAGAGAAALGACLALFNRARKGEGQRARTSLFAASLFMQSGELARYSGRPPARIGGRDYLGPSATDRFYATWDGHVRLFATNREGFVQAGLLSNASAPDEVAVAEIQAGLGSLSREEALERLTGVGIAAVPARHFGELPDDDVVTAGKYFAVQDSVDDRRLYVPGRLARFSRTERQDTIRTPGVGEHSRELLAEAGLSPEAIEELVSSRLVVAGGPVIWFSDAAGRF